MQDDAEAELLLQPQHGHNVVVAMRMVMHGQFTVQHVGELFKGEVARWQLGFIVSGAAHLLPILLRADELLAHERSAFAARA